MMLTRWLQHVDELRNQYKWLLFFSVPKMLLLYHLLQEKNPNLGAIAHEISFLCCNEQAAWKNAQLVVEVSNGWSGTDLCVSTPRHLKSIRPILVILIEFHHCPTTVV